MNMARTQQVRQQHNELLFVKISTRQYPDYLTLAITDLYDQARHSYSIQTRTELQSAITDLGLDALHFHNELNLYRKLWDNLRLSKYGSSLEFMQMELIKKPYPFMHTGKKKSMYCTKLTKEQLSEIAEGVKIDLGYIAAMAQTFGAKQMFDNNQTAGKGTITRPIVYEMLTKEIENFNKFIQLERLHLTIKTTEFYDWDEKTRVISY